MSKAYIPRKLRQLVAQDARQRCGYCLTPRRIIGRPMVIDHLLPESEGGPTVRQNLWLACRRCNEFKSNRTHAVDPLTDATAPLFNPRDQSWSVHFAWNEDGTEIIGLTATGRATVVALQLNNDEIVAARSLWVQAGWHPPAN
ncbi:MAG: HNH endonuclease signature motif containing protein [Chloroflexota bacterium]|nr:HNH endonuclease signature motif containing protein [Chloroflexota bacterium]